MISATTKRERRFCAVESSSNLQLPPCTAEKQCRRVTPMECKLTFLSAPFSSARRGLAKTPAAKHQKKKNKKKKRNFKTQKNKSQPQKLSASSSHHHHTTTAPPQNTTRNSPLRARTDRTTSQCAGTRSSSTIRCDVETSRTR